MSSDLLFSLENWLFTAAVVLYTAAMAAYFIFIAIKNIKVASIATWLIRTGFILHTAAIFCRGIGAGRLPFANQYEFATCFAWGIALCFIVFERKHHFWVLGAFVTPIVVLIIGYAAMLNKDVKPLMPALQSGWLGLHVSTAIIAYGSFAVSCGTSVMYLLNDNMKSHFAGVNVPPKEKLDILGYRATILGFMFLTFVIISGAIWAQKAWGRYWTWDPKETWSLITWLIYAIFLHLRITRGWKEKRAAWLLIIGFLCVIFTYIGVNIFIPSLHSYA